jgi:energy-coupling factor transport system permease protein
MAPLTLDPRTKLFVLLAANGLIFFHMNTRAEVLLALLLLCLLLCAKQIKRAARLGLSYLLLFLLSTVPLSADRGVLASLFGMAYTFRIMMPCFIAGAFAFATTSASEFLCALRKMHLPESVIIPFAVVVRFFPTIAEDYRQIRAAMQFRGIAVGNAALLLHPVQTLEYILIPLLMNANNVADDLSVAAITKGIGIRGEHTCMTEIGFHWQDGLACAAVLLPFWLYFTGVLG